MSSLAACCGLQKLGGETEHGAWCFERGGVATPDLSAAAVAAAVAADEAAAEFACSSACKLCSEGKFISCSAPDCA